MSQADSKQTGYEGSLEEEAVSKTRGNGMRFGVNCNKCVIT
jgi:hypothetical protein